MSKKDAVLCDRCRREEKREAEERRLRPLERLVEKFPSVPDGVEDWDEYELTDAETYRERKVAVNRLIRELLKSRKEWDKFFDEALEHAAKMEDLVEELK